MENVKIINQDNKGPAIATQNGNNLSSGDYLKLVGGDDLMAPECTKFLLQIIKKQKSVAVFSRYKLLESFENIDFRIKEISNLRITTDPLYDAIRSSYSGTSPNLYCNKTIKKSGGCNTKIFIEDFSLVLGIAKFGSFCFVDNVTSYGPKNDPFRIMVGKQTQLIHDFNAALYYFIKKNHNIPEDYKKIACRKAIGRSEKWGRRLKNRTIFNKMNMLKLKFLLGNKDFLNIIRDTCTYFYSSFNKEEIRYKIDYSP